MIDPKLVSLLEVCETGNFTRAAEHLSLTQPAVSQHIHALEQAEKALASALAAPEEDCAATDIREALHCLGAITGRDADEAVIDAIFSRFCVGK